MILAFNHRNAIFEAHREATETGRRQRVRKRVIVNREWWTVEELDAPVVRWRVASLPPGRLPSFPPGRLDAGLARLVRRIPSRSRA